MMKNDRLYFVWNAVLMLCILPFILLAFYTYPSIHDDYLGANYIMKLGSVEYIKSNYLYWTGRYTELVLKSVLSPLIHENSVLIENGMTFGVIVLVFLTIYVACCVIIGRYNAFQISLLLMVILLCGLTNISSFFYWSGGYTAYTFGAIFSLYFLVFLYRLRKNDSIYDLLACAVFVVLACGTYEVVMIAILWIVITNLAYSKIHSKGLKYASALCVVSIVSALFSIFAPGNFARVSGISAEAADMSTIRIIQAACKSLFFATGSVVSWLNNVSLFLGILLLFQTLSKTEQTRKLNFSINPLLICLWLLLGISVSILPSIVAYQAVWVHTWQCVYFFFLLGWLIICNSIFCYFDKTYDVKSFLLNEKMIWFTRIGFVMIIFLSNSSNVHIAYWDLLYVSEYKQRVEARIAEMKRAAKENRVAKLHPLFSASEKYLVPQTLYTVEYNEADAQAFATYYGADSVVVDRCHLQ